MDIIIINGASGSGKTTLAEAYALKHKRTCVLHMASVFKESALAPYTVVGASKGNLAGLVYRIEEKGLKDVPSPELRGKTPREVYIAEGIRLRKEKGRNAVCDMWQKKLYELIEKKEGGFKTLIVPDVRFQHELEFIMANFAPAFKIHLVRMHRGTLNFDNDIGGYVAHWRVRSIDLCNGTNAKIESVLTYFETWKKGRKKQ